MKPRTITLPEGSFAAFRPPIEAAIERSVKTIVTAAKRKSTKCRAATRKQNFNDQLPQTRADGSGAQTTEYNDQ